MSDNCVAEQALPKGFGTVVIGGGVTGLSAAWWLARAGDRVLVLDKGRIGWEASGRNGGGCSHHHSPLFAEEQRLWPLMDDLLGHATEFRPHRIRLAFSEAQMTLYARAVDNAARQGFVSERLDARQAQQAVPLAGPNTVGGYFYKFGGHANPHRTVQAFAASLREKGGQIREDCAVIGIRQAGGRVTGVETEQGVIACERLVIAAGPWTARLAAMLGQRIPLALARAEMIVTEPLPLMPLGGVDGNGLYGRQTLRGNLAYGGGPHEWLDLPAEGGLPRPSTALFGHIARRVAELLPKAAHARIIRSWAGVVENTPDGRPIIDRLPGHDNVVMATLSGVGFGLSPASGRAIADLALAGACSFADITSFSLSRFARLEEDWRERLGWLARAPSDPVSNQKQEARAVTVSAKRTGNAPSVRA